MKIFKTGAIAFILLGIIHLLAQTFGKPDDPTLDRLLLDMQNYKIHLMGDHDLLKFHHGFSIMMGFLLSVFGFQNYLLAKEILSNNKILLSVLAISLIAFIIAVLFFHVLAFSFIAFSFVCFLIAFLKQKTQKGESELTQGS